jgi:hypothetical protein
VKRTAAISLGGAAAVIAIAVYALWPGDRASTQTSAPPHAAPAAVEPGASAAAPPQAGCAPALPAAAVDPYPEHGIDGVSTDDPLTAYRRANVYPPTSRPLSAEHVDLLAPNQRHETARPTDADDGTMFLFTADRYFVIGDEALTATLEVWRDHTPIAPTIRQAFAVVLRPGQAPEPADAIPITYTPRPGGGVIARFAPSTLRGLERQTAIGMYIEFGTGAGETAVQRASFDFQYTPAGGIPARFTGTFSDVIVDGSLVVTAEVDVARAGPYLIDCNLYDAAGQPVAWTRFKAPLAAGRQRAPLVFFGKVLVDAAARGPFRIGQLRGARFDAGRDPDLEQMPPYAGAYETRAYTPDQFSSAEWDSPEKRKMIELLTQQQATGRHQGAATPAPVGEPGDGQ